ncbi:hypothetical protein Golax_004534, partial [Gossypium laxum]|nr:hypothetical protein [Gossypium laxum]
HLIIKGFLDKVEDSVAVRTWSKTTQREKGYSLADGYVSKLWDFTRISVTQNNLQKLKKIWDRWNDEVRQLFYNNYGDPLTVASHLRSIYGLVVFPKALGHVDEAVTDLFDRHDKRVTPISTILTKTFRSLSACRKA